MRNEKGPNIVSSFVLGWFVGSANALLPQAVPGIPGGLFPIAKCSNRDCNTSVAECADFGETLFLNPPTGRMPMATTNQNNNA